MRPKISFVTIMKAAKHKRSILFLNNISVQIKLVSVSDKIAGPLLRYLSG